MSPSPAAASAQVAFSKDFLEAYARLPHAQQKKTREFLEKFRRDPALPSLHCEHIESAVDPKVRSARIDQAYRIIVIQPPRGDVFLCVWVDRHDEAYAWARPRRFDVNPSSGVLQIYETSLADAQITQATAGVPPQFLPKVRDAALFAEHDDESLLLVGVPSALLPAVRALRIDDDLDRLAPHLPQEAAEMLYLMAAGFSITDAIEELERSRQASVNVDDFLSALQHPDTQRSFKLVENDRELEEMLTAPMAQWRIFLHPTQRKVVQMQANGPIRVLGGAGTGKTVALLHRAAYLATRIYPGPDDRMLVTTYTKNLAIDLRTNLRALCGEDARRCDVINLHDWALGFMRRQGVTFHVVAEEDRRRLFQEAMADLAHQGRSFAFLFDEWDRVIQPQNVDQPDAYLTARRVGRGVRLDRRERAALWPVFARYRELLDEAGLKEWPDIIRETLLFIARRKPPTPYRSVLADEVQDFTSNDLRLIRELAPAGQNDLFLAGDGHQRIYGRKTSLGVCGIDIRGRSRRLRLNYRTTEQIRSRAVALLEGCVIDDLDGGTDTLRGFFSLRHGPQPVVRHFEREGREAEFVLTVLRAWLESVPAEEICLSARTHALLQGRYEQMLRDAGIPTVRVEKDPEHEARLPGIRLATMHRMKGLEFRCVLLSGIQEGTMPLLSRSSEEEDEVTRSDRELQERCLLYVAASRARDQLVIAGYGTPSPFLKDWLIAEQ